MTVKELIEELECYDENQIVWIMVDNKYSKVDKVDLEEVNDGEDVVIY